MPPQENVNYLRLKYFTLIKREFSGLERAMTIVARHFLFEGGEEARLEEAELKEILKAWCGFKNAAETPLPSHFNGWLVNYIRRTFLDDKIKSCREKLSLLESEDLREMLNDLFNKISAQESGVEIVKHLAALESFKANHGADLKKIGYEPTQIAALLKALIKLSDKNKNFSKNLFGSLTAAGDIPFRAITYDRIIANALLAGKLRRYYLTCDEELFQTKKILKGSKKLSATDEDMVLKMTAEYLLQRQYTSQEFTETNDSNIMNWVTGARKPENFDRESYVLAETSENIFEVRKVNLSGINALKIKLNPHWVNHFRLIEDGTEGTDSILERIFFSDAGSSEPLRRGVKYS